MLSECHYCPAFLLNVISIGQLAVEGYNFLIKKDILNIIVNDVSMMCGQLSSEIYILSWPINVLYTPNKCSKLDDVDDSYLWHCRLGHINKNMISRLVREGILNDIDCESIKTCESCLFEKMTKLTWWGHQDQNEASSTHMDHRTRLGPQPELKPIY